MGNNGKTDHHHHSSKKDYSHYADIPSSPSDDSISAPQVKPRLIIIHPLDINNTGVEVVNNSPNSPSSDKFVSHKPPVPPVRSDTTKLESNKPSRPPPPKNSTELKAKMEIIEAESQKSKAPSPPPTSNTVSDSVYANLGEIRNSIVPRKPERTNSMREREAKLALELKRRKQPVGELKQENNSSSSDDSEAYKNEEIVIAKPNSFKPVTNNNTSLAPIVMECKKKVIEIENVSTRSKIELFENNAKGSKSPSPSKQLIFLNSDGLKSSVQKMNITIDNYLRNKKMSASDTNLLDSRSPTPPEIIANEITPSPPCNNNNNRMKGTHMTNIELRSSESYEPININVNMNGSKYQRASYPDNGICSPVLTFGNGARSYCGSEIGESEIYSPYSFYGSEAGHDVAQGEFNDASNHQVCTASHRHDELFLFNSNFFIQGSRNSKTVSRLRMRKGRSVVHKNLEDNYSAVIVANHEALAQVLDQV